MSSSAGGVASLLSMSSSTGVAMVMLLRLLMTDVSAAKDRIVHLKKAENYKPSFRALIGLLNYNALPRKDGHQKKEHYIKAIKYKRMKTTGWEISHADALYYMGDSGHPT